MSYDSIDQSQNILGLSKPVIAIVGPTASGKSALAQLLAEQLDGEVVSADSMQIYRGMDIGTGKILSHERLVPHFGFDIVDPGEPFSAALFQEYARACFKEIDRRGKQPFLCGGTGFYIRAALDGYEFPAGEQVNNAVRDAYKDYLLNHSSQELWDLLYQQDPQSASLIAPNDSKRVIRAFELLEEGTTYATQKENLSSIPQVVPALFIGLMVDSAILNKRIDDRVNAMIDAGWMDEVRALLDNGLRQGLTAPQAIGYKELVRVIDGELSLDEAVQLIKTATHRYAKRQRTWFRKDRRIQWIDANTSDVRVLVSEALAIIQSANQSKHYSFER